MKRENNVNTERVVKRNKSRYLKMINLDWEIKYFL